MSTPFERGRSQLDAKISARFFELTAASANIPDFPDLLLREAEKPLAQREYDITDDVVTVRLERCISDGEFVIGEFCRKQITNIPPQAGPEGLIPMSLPDGQGLGHLGAFQYHRPTRIILLQNNRQCVTTHRVGLYLMKLNTGALFAFAPVLREDAIERFKNKKIRSFSVQFASPKNLEALDDSGIASAKGARLLTEAYHGFKMTVSVSVGKRKSKFLDFDRVNEEITALLDSDAELKKLQVGTKDDGDADVAIDFLKEVLKCSETLDLPEKNPKENYEIRINYLKREFSMRIDYLTKHFGPRA